MIKIAENQLYKFKETNFLYYIWVKGFVLYFDKKTKEFRDYSDFRKYYKRGETLDSVIALLYKMGVLEIIED